MVVQLRTAVARSPVRTPRRSTVPQLTPPAIWQRTLFAAGLADRCTIQLSYAIGVAQPLSVYVDLHQTGKVSEDEVEAAIRKVMDLSPSGIRRHLDLNKPIYAKDRILRPFRSQGWPRRILLLGEDRSGQAAQGCAGRPLKVIGSKHSALFHSGLAMRDRLGDRV